MRGKTHILLDPLERAKLNHWMNFSEAFTIYSGMLNCFKRNFNCLPLWSYNKLQWIHSGSLTSAFFLKVSDSKFKNMPGIPMESSHSKMSISAAEITLSRSLKNTNFTIIRTTDAIWVVSPSLLPANDHQIRFPAKHLSQLYTATQNSELSAQPHWHLVVSQGTELFLTKVNEINN
jgi:hypothetical protein